MSTITCGLAVDDLWILRAFYDQETRPAAQPNVRDAADEGGRVKNRERKPSGIENFFNNIFKGGKKKEEKKSSPNSGRR